CLLAVLKWSVLHCWCSLDASNALTIYLFSFLYSFTSSWLSYHCSLSAAAQISPSQTLCRASFTTSAAHSGGIFVHCPLCCTHMAPASPTLSSSEISSTNVCHFSL